MTLNRASFKIPAVFEKVYIEISNICNLKCRFCPEVERDSKIMAADEFRRIATQARPLTKQICLHLMGEPLAHPQFSEIMSLCDELNLKIFLTTNGTLLKKHAGKLKSWKSLEQINFSVHSYFSNPEKISLAEYLEPILNFCEESSLEDRPYYINLRLWNLNSPLAQNDKNLRFFKIIEEKLGRWIKPDVNIYLGKSKKIFGKTYIHFDTEFIWPNLNQEWRSQEGSCYGLRKQLAVHANGDVVPCCLDKEAVLKLGNVKETPLQTILQTEKALKIKNGFNQNQLIEELCQKCQYADRFKK